MSVETGKLLDIYVRLLGAFGPQGWWPGDSPWEVCVGAVLTQNTNWGNVEKAIANLKSAGLVSSSGVRSKIVDIEFAAEVARCPRAELAELIRPSGYFNIKAERLTAVAEWWIENAAEIAGMNMESARESLLAVKGVGPETADSILLYAFDMPTFVIDAYTRRIMSRVLGTPENIAYEEFRRVFMDNLPEDVALFNEFHALFVRLAKDYCRKKGCGGEECPLHGMCGASSRRLERGRDQHF